MSEKFQIVGSLLRPQNLLAYKSQIENVMIFNIRSTTISMATKPVKHKLSKRSSKNKLTTSLALFQTASFQNRSGI
jgi:hypothetical protein